MNAITLALAATLSSVAALPYQSAKVTADRDTTLIEDPDGARANGAGPYFFVGRTGEPVNSIRRGVLHFDLRGDIPKGAEIKKASLVLNVDAVASSGGLVELHRVLQDWGEGGSFATGGRGAPATPGDATWIHTFWPDERWDFPGGHYVAGVSARSDVSNTGSVRLESEQLLRDVQAWVEDPDANFGWVLAGDESRASTALRIDSREGMFRERQPSLEIVYVAPRR